MNEFQPGRRFVGGGSQTVTPTPDSPGIGIGRRGPIDNWTDEVGNGAVIAIDPATGQQQWTLSNTPYVSVIAGHVLATFALKN